jgi:serine protease Do
MILRSAIASMFLITVFVLTATAQDEGARIERTVIFGGMPSSFIGVETRDVTKTNHAEYGLSDVRGVIVERVMEDSPAAKAGLVKGDVILKFEGESVTSVRKLQRLVGEVAPDQTAGLTILRDGSEIQLAVVVGRRESLLSTDGAIGLDSLPEIRIPEIPGIDLRIPRIAQGEVSTYSSRASGRQIGVSVSPLTKQLSNFFGVSGGKGLLISEVRDDSPASKAGIRAGDVIVSVDGVDMRANMDLIRAINRNKESQITLTLVRDKKPVTTVVTPEEIKSDGLLMDRFLLEAPVSAIPPRPFLRLRTPEEPIVIRIHGTN